MILEPISIKREPELNEYWVHKQIEDRPAILGLGELEVRAREKIQPTSGRLDLLLEDPESLKRYVTEVQLGALDESHIIRTIEYWDIERRRYRNCEHAAVIIAEDITSRFLNVIQLFNGCVPLIALKMTAYKINNDYALTFVKIFDELQLGNEDELPPEPTDRRFWENKASKQSVEVVDVLFGSVQEIEPNAKLKFNKHYVGIELDGVAKNFVSFKPQKNGNVLVSVKLAKTPENDELLGELEAFQFVYDSNFGQYRFRFNANCIESIRDSFKDFAKKARSEYSW